MATLEPDEVLIPGLVDTHVHINEPGRTEWEGFDSATRAAAAAGVTTLIDMPLNSLPPTLTAQALAAKRVAARGRCRVDVGFWGGSVPTNLDDLPELFAAGVFGVKCFLQDSGVPEFPPLTTGEMRSAMRVIAGVGGLMLVHAEDPGVLHTAPVPQGPELPGVRRFPAGRGRDRRHRRLHRGGGGHPMPGAHRAPVQRRRGRADPPGEGQRRADHRRNLSALPDSRRRDHPRRRRRSTSAARRSAAGPTRRRCGRAWPTAPSTSWSRDHSPSTPELKLLEVGDLGLAWGGIASLQFGFAAVWRRRAGAAFR